MTQSTWQNGIEKWPPPKVSFLSRVEQSMAAHASVLFGSERRLD